MKNLKLIIGAFILFFAVQSNAQVSVNVNIGSRPEWCGHYEDDVEYFYLPEIEAYYDVNTAVFIYLGPRGWVRSAYLPNYCHDYDLNHGYKVAIDYHGYTPYAYHRHHKVKYFRPNYRNYRQEYYNPGPHRRSTYYAVSPRHDDHDHGHGHQGGHGNGHGHGHRRG